MAIHHYNALLHLQSKETSRLKKEAFFIVSVRKNGSKVQIPTLIGLLFQTGLIFYVLTTGAMREAELKKK